MSASSYAPARRAGGFRGISVLLVHPANHQQRRGVQVAGLRASDDLLRPKRHQWRADNQPSDRRDVGHGRVQRAFLGRHRALPADELGGAGRRAERAPAGILAH